MSTTITSDNGVEIKVAQLGMGVVHPEGITSIWARLSDAQRVELAAALDPGRRGLHVRLDNQASTLATYRRELDAAVIRADRAEREWGAWKARAEQAEKQLREERTAAPAVSRAEIEEQLRIAYESGNHPIERIRIATDAMCDLFGVEAEQAVDPVEAKARELYEVVRSPDWRDWDQLPPADHDEYYRLARHVLGQEATR